MTRRRRNKIELFFLLAGIACITVWGWSLARESIYQQWNSWKFDHRLERPAAPAVYPPVLPPAISPDGVVGRITIPRLALTAMVRQGADMKTLDVAVGHIPGTALPGDSGNVGVAGHRDTFFRGLRDIRQGDLIRFETLRGSYAYRVESTRIVTPDDVAVLNAGAYPQLTLVTCYPFTWIGAAPDRFIVTARQLATQPEIPPLQIARDPVAPHPAEPPSRPGPVKVPFEIPRNHSRQIAPGISVGLTATDPVGKRVEGWMWLMPDRRTIWLRSRSAHEPLDFYQTQDGKRRELVITSVSANSARGYLLTR